MTAEYSLEVFALCPVDGKPDIYACTVRSGRTIQVEDIIAVREELRAAKLFQEDLTAELHRRLAAQVETVGWHSGVRARVVAG